MVATTGMLNRDQVITYVAERAPQYNLDPAAVLAVANHEGLNTAPGSTWILPNESGFNFGPPSWYSGGAGGRIVATQGKAAAAWAWTTEGIDYWLQQVAAVAAGRSGPNAIDAIVRRFENPRADLVPGEVTNATRDYPGFLAKIQGIVPLPGTLPPQIPIPIPGDPNAPQAPAPITTTPSTTETEGVKFSFHILDTPLGPINVTLPWDFSGILLFLAAIFAIIIGAMLWDKTRNVIVKGGEVAAVAAV